MRIAIIAVLLLLSSPGAMAHEETAVPTTTHSTSAWDIAAMSILFVSGFLYAIGSRRLALRGARVRTIERVSFWAGWLAMVTAVAPPMDAAVTRAFSAHMAQHELLILVGAPLMIAGRPVVPWLWSAPALAHSAAIAALQQRGIGSAWTSPTTPVVAWALHGVTIWLWHFPPFYEAAVTSESVHAIQHATFIGTAVLFWWGLLYGRYGRAAYGASALFVFTTMVHTGVLGAMFALSTSPYYSVYQERAAAAGLDATADQQLAGLYMWIPSGVVLMLFGLALVLAWLSESERRSRTSAPSRLSP